MKASILIVLFYFNMLCHTLVFASEPPVTMEDELANTRSFVKQQVLYSVTVRYSGELLNPTMQPPKIPDAIVFQAGDVQEFHTPNQRLTHLAKVTWAIFPLKAGNMHIPSINLKATHTSQNDTLDLSYSPENNNRGVTITDNFVDIKTEGKIVPVITGTSSHLPHCKKLLIQAEWSENPDTLVLGKTIQYIITLKAKGLPAALLPSISIPENDEYNVITHRRENTNDSDAAGITGGYRVAFDMTPKKVGLITLPALSISWWNIEKQRIEITSLPPQQLTVASNAAYMNSQQQNAHHTNESQKVIQSKDSRSLEEKTSAKTPINEAKIQEIKKKRPSFLLFSISIPLLIASVSLAYKVLSRRCLPPNKDKQVEKSAWKYFLETCKSSNLNQIKQALCQWLETELIQKNMGMTEKNQVKLLLAHIDKSLYSLEQNTPDIPSYN